MLWIALGTYLALCYLLGLYLIVRLVTRRKLRTLVWRCFRNRPAAASLPPAAPEIQSVSADAALPKARAA